MNPTELRLQQEHEREFKQRKRRKLMSRLLVGFLLVLYVSSMIVAFLIHTKDIENLNNKIQSIGNASNVIETTTIASIHNTENATTKPLDIKSDGLEEKVKMLEIELANLKDAHEIARQTNLLKKSDYIQMFIHQGKIVEAINFDGNNQEHKRLLEEYLSKLEIYFYNTKFKVDLVQITQDKNNNWILLGEIGGLDVLIPLSTVKMTTDGKVSEYFFPVQSAVMNGYITEYYKKGLAEKFPNIDMTGALSVDISLNNNQGLYTVSLFNKEELSEVYFFEVAGNKIFLKELKE